MSRFSRLPDYVRYRIADERAATQDFVRRARAANRAAERRARPWAYPRKPKPA